MAPFSSKACRSPLWRRRRRQRRWIEDRLMRVGGKRPQRPHLRLGDRIRRIDDAVRRFSRRHQRQRRAHIFGPRQLSFHRRPHAQRRQRRLGVFPGRHGVGVGERQPALAQRARQVEPRRDRQRRRTVGRNDQIERIRQQVHARIGRDQRFFAQIVHPVLIGRNEQLRWRALLDLLGQRVRAGIGDHDGRAGFGAEGRRRLVQRPFQACGGEDEGALGGARRARRDQDRRDE